MYNSEVASILRSKSSRSPRASSRNWVGNHWARRLAGERKWGWNICPHDEAETAGWRQRVSKHPPAPMDWQSVIFKSETMFPSVYTWEQKSKTKKCLKSPWAYFSQMKRLQKMRKTRNRCQWFQRCEEVIIMKLRKAVSWMWIMRVGSLLALILKSVRISTVLVQKF